MSSTERGDEFVCDDELKGLLERWIAPGPSRVLDKRVETSFAREFSGAGGISESTLLSQSREEVVTMKFCSRCEEQFADKFSFCPVDGTPLTAFVREEADPSLTVSRDNMTPGVTVASYSTSDEVPAVEPAYSTSPALVLRDEYHLTIMDDAGLVSRLSHELRDVAHEYELTWPEFKRDPFGFTKRTIVGYGEMLRKILGKPNV